MIDLYYTRKRIVRPDIQREVQQKKKKIFTEKSIGFNILQKLVFFK